MAWDPAILNDSSRRRGGETIERIEREGKSPTRGRVVAGLSFAFWRALFDKKYHQLWASRLHKTFPAFKQHRREQRALRQLVVVYERAMKRFPQRFNTRGARVSSEQRPLGTPRIKDRVAQTAGSHSLPTRRNDPCPARARDQVKDVGELCSGEPNARFEVAAGGNRYQSAQPPRGIRRLPPTLPLGSG